MSALHTPSLPAPAPAMPPEYSLRVTGSVRLVLVINLFSFVAAQDADAFRHLRGSDAFAAALREVHPHAPFGVDEATDKIERDAYALRIFRSRLLNNHFFPTYRVGWDTGMRTRLEQMGCSEIERWQRWSPRVRLTRNGLAVVTLEQPLDDVPLVQCTEQVLELLPHSGQPGVQDQWGLGVTILQAFLDALDCQMSVRINDATRVIHFTDQALRTPPLRLDRYIIYLLQRIARDGRLIPPGDLKCEYVQTLASFMEGSLVECGGERRFPRYAPDQAAALVQADVSSWDDEVCLFTGESALIYYPLVGQGLAYVGGPMGLDAHAYSTYWAGIARGIEHLVTLRSEAQQTERRTTDLLSRVPGLTRKVNDGHLTAADLALIEHLAASLADIFDTLPELRSMAVSTSVFRADYARRKFEALMRELHIQETLNLISTNVEQLDFFLSYYNDMRLQWQAQRTNNLGIALGAIVLFMAVSSFLADTFNVVELVLSRDARDLAVRNFGIEMIVGLVGLLILGFMVWQARKLFDRRAKGRSTE